MTTAKGWLKQNRSNDPIVKAMRQPLSSTRTHGWEYAHTGWSGGDRAGPATIGHTGFTGTGLWIDFENERAWTLLTNRIHTSRYSDSRIADLRRSVGDAINERSR